jgi:hypothetical protein
MAYADPITLATAQVIDDTEWNQYVQDNFRALNRWVDYTPTMNPATNPTFTIGNGTLDGKYIAYEGICFISIHLTFGNLGNRGTGTYQFELPVDPYSTTIPNYRQCIPMVILDDGIAWYYERRAIITGDDPYLDTLASQISPFTFNTFDIIHVNGWYRTN